MANEKYTQVVARKAINNFLIEKSIGSDRHPPLPSKDTGDKSFQEKEFLTIFGHLEEAEDKQGVKLLRAVEKAVVKYLP